MKLKLLVSWTLMFICATSFAQFTSSECAAIENSNSGKNGFYIQYNSIGSICTLGNEHESTLYGREWEYLKERINDRMEGITFGYNRRSKVFRSIFVQYGVAMQYGWYYNSEYYNEIDWSMKVKMSTFALIAPISAIYRFELPNPDFCLEPMIGLDLRYNYLVDLRVKSNIAKPNYYVEDAYSYIDIFSTKKCESTAKRFQIGWHIGLNLAYRKYYVGISYGSDLSKIYDGSVGVKLNTVSITTGITY